MALKIVVNFFVACGNCDVIRAEPGCDVLPVESCVCRLDNLCCTISWDGVCVDLATSDCRCQRMYGQSTNTDKSIKCDWGYF